MFTNKQLAPVSNERGQSQSFLTINSKTIESLSFQAFVFNECRQKFDQ